MSAARAEKAAGNHRAPPAETGAIRRVQQQQVVHLSLSVTPSVSSPRSSQWDPSMFHLHFHGNISPATPFPSYHDNYAKKDPSSVWYFLFFFVFYICDFYSYTYSRFLGLTVSNGLGRNPGLVLFFFFCLFTTMGPSNDP